MEEARRTQRYRKDDRREARLRDLNERLAPLQDGLDAQLTTPTLPVVFVIGPPRSGTTLVSQLLAHSGALGYVSNFVARFWRAPMVGAQIETALGIRDRESPSSFRSEHGVTQGWAEPHEFGYFWDHWFDRGQETHRLSATELADIDGSTLARRMASLEAAYALPMSFKNNSWCTFQAGWLARLLPTSTFLLCRRNPVYVAQSLLLTRRARLGSEDAWWSVRPSSYARIRRLSWWEQVAAQALEIEREMDDAIAEIDTGRTLDVPYADLCAAPRVTFDAVADLLARRGLTLEPRHAMPERFEGSDTKRLPDDEWRRVVVAVERFRERGLPV